MSHRKKMPLLISSLSRTTTDWLACPLVFDSSPVMRHNAAVSIDLGRKEVFE